MIGINNQIFMNIIHSILFGDLSFQVYYRQQYLSQLIMRKDLIAFISYSITNMSTTLLLKLAGNVEVSEGGQVRTFFHPIMQTLIMFIGEGLCIVPFFLLAKTLKKKNDPQKLPAKFSLCFIPTLLDLFSSLMIFISLNYISGSVYSVLTGELVVFTAIFSKIFLKAVYNRAQIVGSVAITISAILAGVAEMLGEKTNQQYDEIILGITLVTIAQVMFAYFTVYYEKMFAKYDIVPLQIVGYQGSFGMILTIIIVTILSFTSCPFSDDKCVFDQQGSVHIQSASSYFSELGGSPYLLILNLVFILFVGRYNYDQSTAIASASAFTLCIIRIFSNSFVWIIGIVVSYIGDDNKELDIQSLQLDVNLVKLAAFVLSTLGLLIYNEVIFKNLLIDPQLKRESDLLITQNSDLAQ